MRNHDRSCFLLLWALVVLGCSGSGATVGDPLGTDTVTVSASVTTLGVGQSSVITATVTRLNGLPATDRSVSFTFQANNSGGTLSIVNENCDSQGKAVAIYTAGSLLAASAVQDTIRVRLANDSSAAVVITRTGGGGSAGARIASMTASTASVDFGASSIITVRVADAADAPVSGEPITFTLPVRNSGSPTLFPAAGTTLLTDGAGTVVVTYVPGTGSPAGAVDDVVQATLANGSTRAVIISRGAQPGLSQPAILSLTANPSTALPPHLEAGQSSIITALVVDTAGAPVSGAVVTFSIPINASGSTLLPAAGTVMRTDSTGTVAAVYTSGNGSPTAAVEDILQASLPNGSTRAVIIRRAGQTASQPVITSLTALPS